MFWKAIKPLFASLAVVAAFMAMLAVAGLLSQICRPVAQGYLPAYALSLIELLFRSMVLVAVALTTRTSRKVGLKLPTGTDGFIALPAVVVFIVYFVTMTSSGGRPYSEIGLELFLFTALMAMLTGFWEELFFRGFALRLLAPCGVLGSLLVCSLLFGVVHLRPSADLLTLLSNIVPAFSLGLVFAINRLQTESLLPAIVAHGAIDLFHFLLHGDSRAAADKGTDLASFSLYILLALPILIYCYIAIRKNLSQWKLRYDEGTA